MAEAEALRHQSVQSQVSDAEWEQRVKLAAAYRLTAMFGWDDLIYTHLSARVPGPDHHFLINPLGLLFDEITASSLIKIDLNGNKVMDSPYIPNAAGFVIHSAVHEAREDAHCVIHLHTEHGIAVSACKEGLLPVSQSSIFPWSSLAYHEFEGLAVRPDEKERLVADLGDKTVMLLRNHGTLSVGSSVAKAFEAMYFLEKACRIQTLAAAAAGGPDKISLPSEQSIQNTIDDLRSVAGADGADLLVFPALMRKLDRTDASYRE